VLCIKDIREKKKFTQEFIALKMGVTVATVSRWETGEMLPRASRLKQLAKVLGCSVNKLLEQTDSKP
jgi:transcriptional regulator with XRE-family HTH domain